MVQLDGSITPGCQHRGPKFRHCWWPWTIRPAAVNAVVRTGEDTRGYHAVGWPDPAGAFPWRCTDDRHAVFKHNARQPETAGEATQFTRGLQELGIRQIFARSPQAKGRVERMRSFGQVTELRLADARTIGQATAVLRDWPVSPCTRAPDAAATAQWPATSCPERCFKRKVGRDHGEVPLALQLPGSGTSQVRRKVLERLDSELIVQYQGHTVARRNPRRAWAHCGLQSAPGLPAELRRIVSSMGDHHIARSPQRRLAALEPVHRRGQGQDRCRKGRRQQGAGHMGAYADAHPEGPVEGDPAGQLKGRPAGHCLHETPCVSTLRPGASQADSATRIWQPSPTNQMDIFAFHLIGQNRPR